MSSSFFLLCRRSPVSGSPEAKAFTGDQSEKSITSSNAMSIKEILEELPKLTEEERQLWKVLDHELTPEEDGESPEVLAAR